MQDVGLYATSYSEGARITFENRSGITAPRICVETITPTLVLCE